MEFLKNVSKKNIIMIGGSIILLIIIIGLLVTYNNKNNNQHDNNNQDNLIINWSLKEKVILVSKRCVDDIKYYDVFKKIFDHYSKMYTIYNKDNNEEINILNSDLEKKCLTNKTIRKYTNNMINYGNPMKNFNYEFKVLDTNVTLKLTFPSNLPSL